MTTQLVDDDPQRWPGGRARRWGRLAEDIRRRLGPGAPLAAPARAMFEGRLGSDVSGAMVHRSPLGGAVARSLAAGALSVGDHIIGDEASLATDTRAGAALLGHELAHVVQRDADPAGEAAAQVIERDIGDPTSAPAAIERSPKVDPEVVAERVYRKMMAELWRDRDRAAWLA
jgi:hypothetical protein